MSSTADYAGDGTADRVMPRIAMLLDNHYDPDPRVELESMLLKSAGARVRIVAWDRRAGVAGTGDGTEQGEPAAPELIRIHVPAPRGGGRATFSAMLRFAREVWRRRRVLLGDADVIVAHDIYLLPLGWLLSVVLRAPLIYDAHEDYAAMEGWRYPRWWLTVMTAIENLLARRAKVIVVPGATRCARWEDRGFAWPVVLRNLGVSPRPSADGPGTKWDIAYCGTLADVRRPDVLLGAARARPELKIVIAGAGRGEQTVVSAAEELPNVDYLGWIRNADEVCTQARTIFYGLDPAHPYSRLACPNTLYDAVRLRRPLLYFCGGEVAEIQARHRIGVRCAADSASLLAAIDEVTRASSGWEFDAAWEELARPELAQPYVDAVLAAARCRARGAGGRLG
jgi:hypothetical protein